MALLKQFVFNDFEVNSFVVYDETKEAIIVDGAANSEYELTELLEFIKKNELQVKYIVSTHGHLDHICGNADLKNYFKVPVIMHRESDFWVERAMQQAQMYSFNMKQPPKADIYVDDGDKIIFGNTELNIFHVPGHSPCSICLYCAKDNFVITGDTLFHSSIGRTDFPKGNHHDLLTNIKNKLFTLPEDTTVFSGHGIGTDIKFEKKNNVFF